MKVKRALISVSDKTGVEAFASALAGMGVALVASGGTARLLSRAGISVTAVSEVTGSPEMLGGRVKTLHPNIHGAILADRTNPQHLEQLREAGIMPIDLVVCNLYPFAATLAKAEAGEEEITEQIDVGGPAMVRAGAKNHQSVAVVVDPGEYPLVIDEMKSRAGGLSDATRRRLAAAAFSHTAEYDATVAQWMGKSSGRFPQRLSMHLDLQTQLRYGENPHQQAAFYAHGDPGWKQLAGKELSYTNVLDLDAAWRLCTEFAQPAVAIIKHTNPCGVGLGDFIEEAYRQAVDCDPRSAFGGIVAANQEIDAATAKAMTELIAVTDIVIASGFARQALNHLKAKKNLRIIQASGFANQQGVRSSAGGYLVQDPDDSADDRAEMVVAGSVQPDESQWLDMLFAWKVCKHVKSNAAVFAAGGQAVGVGAGQMSRVEAVELAARRAGDRAKGAVMATDGFFPFRDGVDEAVKAGASAIIQPGGSVRDGEVIVAADEHKIPIVFTGKRHFNH